jgi:hypothetical protein
MKRTQVVAIVAGATLAAAGVAAGIALSRKEGRVAARQLLTRADAVALQARKAGERVVGTAADQYRTLAPKAADALQAVREQAPHAVETLAGTLPKLSANHKHEPAEVTA